MWPKVVWLFSISAWYVGWELRAKRDTRLFRWTNTALIVYIVDSFVVLIWVTEPI